MRREEAISTLRSYLPRCRLPWLLWPLLLLCACSKGEGGSAEPLSYEGSATIGQQLLPELAASFEKATGLKFGTIKFSGSSPGFESVMAGRVSVAGVGRALKSSEKAQNPYYELVGYDAIAVFVHPSNPVRALTRVQLKDIFMGNLTRWSEVGGPDALIEPVTERLGGGHATQEFFREVAMQSAFFGNHRELELPGDCVRYVSSHPYAITYASTTFQAANVGMLALDGVLPTPQAVRNGDYLLARPLLLVSRSLPQGPLKAFFDHVLSDEGQAVIARHFVPRAGGR